MTRARPPRPLVALAAATALALAGAAAAERAFVTIGTGDVTSVFYQAGGGICDRVNAGRARHRIRCTVASSPGAVANIEALRRGERAFGFAQADVVLQAHEGSGIFAGRGGFSGLRVVLAMHPESVTVVARDDAGIDAVQDLRGKRVNIGPVGSGQRATMRALMDALGWTRDDFARSLELDTPEQVDAVCDGAIDAAVFITGHPNNAVKQALACGTRLVPVDGPAIERLVGGSYHYNETVIPGGLYAGVARDVPTYGVITLLLSSTHTARDTVLEVTRAVLEQVDALREWHRALAGLEPGAMARGTVAIGAPLHPGAVMYYAEAELLRQ